MSATALDAQGNEVRTTATHHYQLPPPLPGRHQAEFNGNNQYRLPHPDTGKITSYSRATSLAKMLDDMYMVHRWNVRKTLLGLASRQDLKTDLHRIKSDIESTETTEEDSRGALENIAEEAASAAGTNTANEFGSAVHDWAAYVDAGLISVHQVPEMFRAHVIRHLQLLADHQLTVLPEYTERVVMNTELNTVGTLDRVLLKRLRPGDSNSLVLGDLKTSAKLDFSWLSFAVQLAFYQSCDLMLSEDGTCWEPMPSLDDTVAFVVHLPSTDLVKAAIVPIDLAFGREALAHAVRVKDIRSRAKKSAPSTIDMTPELSLTRWFAARLAIQVSTSYEDVSRAWLEYQDVWTHDLTTLGNETIEAHAHEKRNAP